MPGVTATDPNTPAKTDGATTDAAELPHRKAARYVLALLLARIYEVLLLLCPQCGGGEIKIIAFMTEGPAIREILCHPGVPTSPPALKPARGAAVGNAGLPAWRDGVASGHRSAGAAGDGLRVRSAHRVVRQTNTRRSSGATRA
ncbi:MAG: hypothetical protein IPP03_18110 [Dechloromonas sp.]|jgi:hypothetical protein|nr:hypothetical protein [Candidatus Dechloromonas phosphoritropha]MBP8787567.1 hypothetical protein [Azonexus sp.]MBP9228115.1 hypothetical protein [Azonexus sp.]